MPTTPKHRVNHIIKCIHGTGGIKTLIAKNLGVARQTVLRYERKHSSVRDAIIAEREKVLDAAEAVLFRKIKEGDIDTVKWYLARAGKDRGYSKKIETSHTEKLKFEWLPEIDNVP